MFDSNRKYSWWHIFKLNEFDDVAEVKTVWNASWSWVHCSLFQMQLVWYTWDRQDGVWLGKLGDSDLATSDTVNFVNNSTPMESKSNNVTESTTTVGKIYQVGPTLRKSLLYYFMKYEFIFLTWFTNIHHHLISGRRHEGRRDDTRRDVTFVSHKLPTSGYFYCSIFYIISSFRLVLFLLFQFSWHDWHKTIGK